MFNSGVAKYNVKLENDKAQCPIPFMRLANTKI